MVDQELAQRAVLEALEGKIEALRGVGGLSRPVTLQLYFWDDLQEKHPKVFRAATTEDIALAISTVEKESEGHYKLLSIKPALADRDVLRVAQIEENGRILDISNLYWKVQYKEKPIISTVSNGAQVFWLTPREIYSTTANQKRAFALRPHGVQHRLLGWFAEHAGFTKSDDLAQELKTTRRTVATEVAKLKQKADKAFGVDNFIESSHGEGYRLVPRIKIKVEKDTP